MEFIENVKNEIKKQGITKTELGRNTEISEGTIRSWEKGKQPSLDKACKIAQYLNISLDELCGIEINYDNKKIITAYEKADQGTQAAVRKLLDVEDLEMEKTTIEELEEEHELIS